MRIVAAIFLLISLQCHANWYFLAVQGKDDNNGKTPETAFATFQFALSQMQPGDRLYVLPGIYSQAIATVRPGAPQQNIHITGNRQAIVRGSQDHRVLSINHSYVRVSGITIDSKHGKGLKLEDYRDKLVEVGSLDNSPIVGVELEGLVLKNAYGECLRVRRHVHNSLIINNHISQCGLRDTRFGRGQSNSEGIYIGTAPEQWSLGGYDTTRNILIQGNTISRGIGECIDIKERATGVQVVANICEYPEQVNSGGINIRGSNNQVYANLVVNGAGAGIRIGGDEKLHARNNSVKDNHLANNAEGGLKIMNWPQEVCDNLVIQANGQKKIRLGSKVPGSAGEACDG